MQIHLAHDRAVAVRTEPRPACSCPAGAPGVHTTVLWAAPQDDLFGQEVASPADPKRTGTSIPAPLAWEKLLVDAAVIGGYERGARRLAGREGESRGQLGAPSVEGPDAAGRRGSARARSGPR